MKNFFKRIALLIILSLFSMAAGGFVLLQSFDKPQKASASNPATETIDGMQYYVYEIPNVEVLNDADIRTAMGIVSSPANYFRLTNNIDLSNIPDWNPIPLLAGGNVLDGGYSENGRYQIKNMKMPNGGSGKGFIHTLHGTVKNIEFTNVSITGWGTVGVVAASVYNGAYEDAHGVHAVIENVGIESGTISGTAGLGGLVGSVSAMSIGFPVELRVIHCYNKAVINGLGPNVGGLIGTINTGKVFITDSYNSGNITSMFTSSGTYHGIGGLVGYAYNQSELHISYSYNNGALTITHGNFIEHYMGGLVGYAAASSKVYIDFCYNEGIVAGGGFAGSYGGFIGFLDTGSTASSAEVRNSLNIANVAGFGPRYGLIPAEGGNVIKDCFYVYPNPSTNAHENYPEGYLGGSQSSISEFKWRLGALKEIISNRKQQEINTYTVTLPQIRTGFSITEFQPDKVVPNSPYIFAVNPDEHYNVTSVKYSFADGTYIDTKITPASGIIYTVPNVTSDVTITIESELKQYGVTLPQGSTELGFAAVPAVTTSPSGGTYETPAAYGETYRFTVILEESHRAARPIITAEGQAVTISAVNAVNPLETDPDGKYTCFFTVIKPTVISVSAAQNQYTVTGANGMGYSYTAVTQLPVNHNQSFVFRITLGIEYSKCGGNFTITVDGTDITDTKTAAGERVYEFTTQNVTKNLTAADFKFGDITKNTYTVTGTGMPGKYTYAPISSPTVSYGETFCFMITMDATFTQNGATLAIEGATRSGTGPYIFTFASVTNDINIDSLIGELTKNKYSVTGGAAGIYQFLIPEYPDGFIVHGKIFYFSIILEIPYYGSNVQVTGATRMPGNGPSSYDFSFTSPVTSNIDINDLITGINRTTHTITCADINGIYTFSPSGNSEIRNEESYSFIITLNAAYTQSGTALKDRLFTAGAELIDENGAFYSFVFQSVTKNINVNNIIGSLTKNTYTVTGAGVAGKYAYDSVDPVTVTHGEAFRFTITLFAEYSQCGTNFTVTADGVDITSTKINKNGLVYEFTIANVTKTLQAADFIISGIVTKNTYTVTGPTDTAGFSYTAVSQNPITHDQPFIFRIGINTEYSQCCEIFTVTINGTELTGTDKGSRVYEFTIASITSNLTAADFVILGVTVNTCTVEFDAANGTGYSVNNTISPSPVNWNGEYTFKVTTSGNYTKWEPSVTYTIAGASGTFTLSSNRLASLVNGGSSTWEYTIINITDTITVYVIPNINTYSVTITQPPDIAIGSIRIGNSIVQTETVNHGDNLSLNLVSSINYYAVKLIITYASGQVIEVNNPPSVYLLGNITGDVTVEAVFGKIQVRITFIPNNASGSSQQKTIDSGTAYSWADFTAMGIAAPSREFYKLIGWTVVPNSTVGIFDVTSGTITLGANTAYYALWDTISYSLFINQDEVTASSNLEYIKADSNTVITADGNGSIIWEVFVPSSDAWVELGFRGASFNASKLLADNYYIFVSAYAQLISPGEYQLSFRAVYGNSASSISINAQYLYDSITYTSGYGSGKLENGSIIEVSRSDSTDCFITIAITPKPNYIIKKVILESVANTLDITDDNTYKQANGIYKIKITEAVYDIYVEFETKQYTVILEAESFTGENLAALDIFVKSNLVENKISLENNYLIVTLDQIPEISGYENYEFVDFAIRLPNGYFAFGSETRQIAIPIDEYFFIKYLYNDISITVCARFNTIFNLAVESNTDGDYNADGGKYFVSYEIADSFGGTKMQTISHPKTGEYINWNTRIEIEIIPNNNSSISGISGIPDGFTISWVCEGEIKQELFDGIWPSGTVTIVFNIFETMELDIHFVLASTFVLTVETIDGYDKSELLNSYSIEDLYLGLVIFPNIKAEPVEGYNFVGWRYKKANGEWETTKFLEDLEDYDLFIDIVDATAIALIKFDSVFFESLINNGQIVLGAFYEANTTLFVNVLEAEKGINAFKVFIGGVIYIDNIHTDGIFRERAEIEIERGVSVEIKAENGSKYTYDGFEGNTTSLIFDMNRMTTVNLKFKANQYTINKDGGSISKNGFYSFEAASFTIGDTVVIKFNAESWYQVSKMTLGGIDLETLKHDEDMTYSNGSLTIRVTSGWLARAEGYGWFEDAQFKPDVVIETEIAPLYMYGLGGAGILAVIIILGIILYIISIKKKNAKHMLPQ